MISDDWVVAVIVGLVQHGYDFSHSGEAMMGFIQCRFSSTDTLRTIRDGESRTSTSSFTQLLLSSAEWWVQCCFTFTETIRTVRELGAQDVHLDFHKVNMVLNVHRNHKAY